MSPVCDCSCNYWLQQREKNIINDSKLPRNVKCEMWNQHWQIWNPGRSLIIYTVAFKPGPGVIDHDDIDFWILVQDYACGDNYMALKQEICLKDFK